MGYILEKESFNEVLKKLGEKYRLYAPVRKIGEGRFTDVDVVRYDFVNCLEDMELEAKSDYSFKELLTPLSQTLFFFTEGETKEADMDTSDVIIFLRACDLHSVKRLDDIYLNNKFADPFYEKIRAHVQFALIGCSHSFENCFCVDMESNIAPEQYLFSLDVSGDLVKSAVRSEEIEKLFQSVSAKQEEVIPAHVTENPVRVEIPDEIPNTVYQSKLWEEYSARCIDCGRCNMVCPTCTCFTMQDTFYTENGKVGERRRVAASCMINGYTRVAGGGEYRRTNGERMRFKVLHKISDHRKRFGYNMCVGCGRCDDVCPEYIKFSNIINKVNRAVKEEGVR
ncbi:MAG: anaerobic sulfite reductase subunit AsrA [Lachnospiraceae bacterium]|nr:anaerobic sulfite reductase subunit AsrA [Lachnospiraceae bacterium]